MEGVSVAHDATPSESMTRISTTFNVVDVSNPESQPLDKERLKIAMHHGAKQQHARNKGRTYLYKQHCAKLELTRT